MFSVKESVLRCVQYIDFISTKSFLKVNGEIIYKTCSPVGLQRYLKVKRTLRKAVQQLHDMLFPVAQSCTGESLKG